MGKSSGASQQPVTQTTAPWGDQQPYLKDVMSEASRIYHDPANYPQAYQGQTVAAPNAATQYAQNYLTDVAQNTLPGVNNTLKKAVDFGLGGVLDPSSNPNLQGYIDAANRPIYQNLTENVLPQVRAGALASGQYGGSRQGIAEGLAAQSTQQAAADNSAKITQGAYNQGLDTFYRTLALAPQTVQALEEPGAIMGAVGAQQNAYEQALLNDQIAKYNYGQTLPLTMLNQYQNLVQGNYGGTTTTQALGEANSAGPLSGALSGAASGAMFGSIIPGVGTALGAGVGGLIGLFS